jgi:putative ABC transport system ATP-binding protein
MLLQIDGLRLSLGGREILNLPHLAVGEGEHALLLGPSGSGKTSLINVIAGLVTPEAGRVLVDGQDMAALSPAARDALRRRAIAIVFQTLRLIPALSVRDNLLLAQRLATGRADGSAADAALAVLGISHRARARPRELSQGEAQRAAIARAIVARPRLIIADEPTAALDDANAARVADLLLDAAAQGGATLLVATHDARLAGRFPRRIELAAPVTGRREAMAA